MLKKSTITAAMLVTLCGNVSANQGAGNVTFKGVIVQAPCSIKQESIAQTVEFGQIFTSAFTPGNANNAITMKAFDIELVGCEGIAQDTDVEITFNGYASEEAKSLLIIKTGKNQENSGAAIKITNLADEAFEFGTSKKVTGLVANDESKKLSFKAQVVKVGQANVIPGEFTATADFILSYK